MKYFTLGNKLPNSLSTPLFGDRKRFGLTVQLNDPCWQEWQKTYLNFYYSNQKKSIGAIINSAGYKVISKLDMSDKKILEIGPGNLDHITNWKTTPKEFVVADIQSEVLNIASQKLEEAGFSYNSILLKREHQGSLPFPKETFDIIISFYSLEHLYPLEIHLHEMLRVLKNGGHLIGAIPCEGGLAWGLGRFLTTRRWFKKYTTINPDKIICWEHPNFAEQILGSLDEFMIKRYLSYWPMKISSIDMNLVASFVYEKA